MRGTLEVITGPMYAGKSEELIRRLARFEIAKKTVTVLNPDIDTRYGVGHIYSHNGKSFKAKQIPVQGQAVSIFDTDVVAFDEAQFFNHIWLVNTISDILNTKIIIIVARLDKNFRGEAFGLGMPILMAMADKVTKLTAICQECGAEATMTQRLLNGNPAPFDGETVVVGAQEQYEARCNQCWQKG